MKHLTDSSSLDLRWFSRLVSLLPNRSGSGGSSSGGSAQAAEQPGPAQELQDALRLLDLLVARTAWGSTPNGPITPNRSNVRSFPPSRLAPRPGGSYTRTPAQARPRRLTKAAPTKTALGSNPQDPAAAGSGRAPSPRTGGAGGPTETGKNPHRDGFGLHEVLGPRDTHEQSRLGRTCRRVQGRSG